MTSLDFLYWALGIGFSIFIIVTSIAIIQLIRILRDAADITAVTKKTVQSLDKNMSEIAQKVTSTADQISDYIIKPFNMTQHLFEWFKPVLDRFRDRIIHMDEMQHHDEDDEDEVKPKRRRRFVRK